MLKTCGNEKAQERLVPGPFQMRLRPLGAHVANRLLPRNSGSADTTFDLSLKRSRMKAARYLPFKIKRVISFPPQVVDRLVLQPKQKRKSDLTITQLDLVESIVLYLSIHLTLDRAK